jgi:hypothetical protein
MNIPNSPIDSPAAWLGIEQRTRNGLGRIASCVSEWTNKTA